MSTLGPDPDEFFVGVESDAGDADLLVLLDAVAEDAVQKLELVLRQVLVG